MSVISIRPSQARLQNLGNTITPNHMQHFVSPHNSVADKSIVPKAVGDLAKAIQQAGGQMMAAYFGYKQQEKNILLAEAGAAYQERMRDAFVGTDEAPGLMARTGDKLKNIDRDAKDAAAKVLNEVCDEKGISGNLRRTFEAHINPVRQSYDSLMARHILTETQKQRQATATVNREASYNSWLMNPNDIQQTAKTISDFEHERREHGDTEELVRANTRKFATSLAADITLAAISACKSEADFDSVIETLKTDPDKFYRENEALYAELGAGAFNPKTLKGLQSQAMLERDQIVREQAKVFNDQVDYLVSKGCEAEAKGVVSDMESAIVDLRNKAETLPEGSKVRLAAVQAAERLDKSADSLAGQQMLAEYLDILETDPDYRLDDGAPNEAYRGDPRKERLCKEVQQIFDKQMEPARAAQRKANADNLRAYMAYCANEPAKFRDAVYSAAVEGDITLKDYLALNKEFDTAWMKGFEAGKQSPAQLVAQDMLDDLKKIFPNDNIDTAFIWNAQTGMLDLTKDADKDGFIYPGFEYKPKGNWFQTTSVGSGMVRDLLAAATEFARYDGENLGYDPITMSTETDFFGDKIDKDKPFNAREYFRKYLQRMKDSEETAEAAEAVSRFVEGSERYRRSFDQLRAQNMATLQENEKKPERSIRWQKPAIGTATAK